MDVTATGKCRCLLDENTQALIRMHWMPDLSIMRCMLLGWPPVVQCEILWVLASCSAGLVAHADSRI